MARKKKPDPAHVVPVEPPTVAAPGAPSEAALAMYRAAAQGDDKAFEKARAGV